MFPHVGGLISQPKLFEEGIFAVWLIIIGNRFAHFDRHTGIECPKVSIYASGFPKETLQTYLADKKLYKVRDEKHYRLGLLA